jgi:3-oxoacyl-[acyl-carrier protein] reductase
MNTKNIKKTAIITGASRGIGAETARLLAKNGYNVIINYNKSKECALKLKEEINRDYPDIGAEIYKCDVANYSECEKLVKFVLSIFGKVDVLVANAGIAQTKLLIDTTEDDFDKITEVNLKGVYNIVKTVTPNMISNHYGKIITVSSICGTCGSSCEVIYSASKAGIVGFTKALAKELGPSNINVNCVAPGLIDTEMTADTSYEEKKSIIDNTPIRRIGTPQDIANAILFLASDDASFINGCILNVDGGLVI